MKKFLTSVWYVLVALFIIFMFIFMINSMLHMPKSELTKEEARHFSRVSRMLMFGVSL